MPDGRRRSREHWSDAMEDGPPAAPAHTHRLPPVVRLAVLGLTVAMFLALIGVGLLATYVYQQQQYMQGKGAQRDRENAEMNQRITDRICDLLALSPADSPQADYYREQLGCSQPGVPTGELPPEIRQRYEGAAPAARPAAVQPPTPDLGSAAVPDPPRPPANTPPATRTPAPEPSPEPPPSAPPLVDLGPITDPLCESLGICV